MGKEFSRDGISHRFPGKLRLTIGAQFSYVFANPRVSQDRCFRVLHRPNGLDHSRLGMAVSLKVSKSAVVRNRLKRVIRESFRQNHQGWTDRGSFDVVVLPGWHAATISKPELNKSLETHWGKMGNTKPRGSTRKRRTGR